MHTPFLTSKEISNITKANRKKIVDKTEHVKKGRYQVIASKTLLKKKIFF